MNNGWNQVSYILILLDDTSLSNYVLLIVAWDINHFSMKNHRCEQPYFRSSHWRCSVTKGVLRKFAKFTGKTCARVSFLINFIKKSLWHRCFPVNFAKFLRTPFLQNTSGRLLLILKQPLIHTKMFSLMLNTKCFLYC